MTQKQEPTALSTFAKHYKLRSGMTLGEIVDYYKKEWLAWQSCWNIATEQMQAENELQLKQIAAYKKALGIVGDLQAKMRQTAIDQKQKGDRKRRRKARKVKRK